MVAGAYHTDKLVVIGYTIVRKKKSCAAIVASKPKRTTTTVIVNEIRMDASQ